MSGKIIVGIGEALWDVFPSHKALGGAPANFAYTVGQLGFESYAVSAIGNDELGRDMQKQFANRGVKSYLVQSDKPTGQVLVQLDEKGVPQYEICEDVAWDNIPLTDELKELALKTDVVCFGSLAQRAETSRQTINAFLALMPNGPEVLKICDINLRQSFYNKDVLENSFKVANVLKTNDEEIEVIAQLFSYTSQDMLQVCKEIVKEYHLKMIILTCGVAGSYVVTDNNVSFCHTPLVEVADTVGAGDSFTASFCAALLKGLSIPEAHQFAVDVSAYVCTQNGAMVTYTEDILDRL